ncbi:3-deoxy-manno-octulosonate-8-phosphatase KdsC [Kistimonas scapharcae]|uniref:3-deoxy-D-manno-octulosonate 8-phosphate phosphatase KdsC n=1 Tax=Kistimonas scapharcae TaxID=1036133 RepID=A0ABP8V1J4_9GAMM
MTHPQRVPESVRLVIFDIDGVLTDGALWYGEHGEVVKPFNAKDGVGFRLLQDNGIEVAVITAKQSAPLARRMADLKVRHFYPGCHDKRAAFHQLLDTLGIMPEAVAYVGDDVLDLPVMELVGWPVAPADAYPMVLEQAAWVTQAVGGRGVVREVADTLVAARTNLVEAYRRLVAPAEAIVQ